MTPMGSGAAMSRGRLAERGLTDLADAARQREHLRVREAARERVGDPVGRFSGAPGDDPELRAVVEELVGAAAHAAALGRVVEDRRAGPAHARDAVVLAEAVGLD